MSRGACAIGCILVIGLFNGTASADFYDPFDVDAAGQAYTAANFNVINPDFGWDADGFVGTMIKVDSTSKCTR